MRQKSLALDGSGPLGGVALLEGGHLLAEASFAEGPGFGVTLFTRIETLLEEHGLAVADLGLLTVALGPGSFTGLRVALGIAKGMALVHNIPIAGISTLAMEAHAVEHEGWIVPLRDAGNDWLFYGLFKNTKGVVQESSPPTMGRFAELVAMSSDRPGGDAICFCGAGLVGSHRRLEECFGERFRASQTPYCQPSAALLGRMGHELWQKGELSSSLHLEPLYLRPPQAEMNRWEQKG